MKSHKHVSCFAASLVCALFVTAVAGAVTPTRVFLGLNGNNGNDCSNPATPCFSFVGALAQVAEGGEVIIEATGGYGPLNITKSISINTAAGVVGFSAYTVTVNVPNGVVVLRGLTIDGGFATANGIDVSAVSALHVENCTILLFNGNGINFASNGHLFVKDTIVRNNSTYGVYVAPATLTAQASIDHCRVENNEFGVYSASSASTTVNESVLSGQTLAGAGAIGTGELNLESCLVANNGFGIISNAGTTVRVSNTTVTDNETGLDAIGGNLLSRSNNTVEGNGITNGTFTGTYGAK